MVTTCYQCVNKQVQVANLLINMMVNKLFIIKLVKIINKLLYTQIHIKQKFG